jgi:iron complex outermembrane receptor protein
MFKSVLLASCALSSLASLGFAVTAQAQASAQDSQAPTEVTVIARATHIAPSSAPLDVVEPTSTVQAGFLKNNIIPLASVDDIIKFQPSVWTQNPNGPGIGKAEEMTLRGFQDGQYNVTFDGIPFGDATDLHHTTGSLFIAHDLQTAVIDRGPGTGATIGKATFGGTIGFLSKDVPTVGGVELYGTTGSFNTQAYGVELDSGKQGGVNGFFDAQHEQTDGYLTHSNEKRDNLAGKMTLDLDDKTSVTVLGSWNHEFQYTTQGATLAQYAKNGNNYGLCGDPTLQCYYGYQPSNYFSDFEYVDVKHDFGGVRIDNTLYHDGFEHDYQESKDASDDVAKDNTVTPYTIISTSPLTTKKGTALADIPGKRADAVVNSLGDIFRVEIDTPLGVVKTGVWVEQQNDHRYSLTNDITKGYVPVTGKLGTAYSYLYKDTGVTYQPYVELDWKPTDQLTVIPGVKYTSYRRDVDAVVNKTVGGTLDQGVTYSAWQPSLAANYRLSPDWAGYAQVAKGFLAPPIDTFNVNVITPLKPEETMNYQVGTSVRKHNWTLGADLYYIDFDNYLSPQTILVDGSAQTTFRNGGGAIYKGVELEAQYALPNGLSLYANYSDNDAKYKHSNIILAEAPEYTAAAGILYDDAHGLYYSVIGKEIGPRFGDDSAGSAPGDVANSRVGATFTVDLAAGYHFHTPITKNLTASIKVGNLLDSHKVVDYAGTQSVSGTPLYWLTPGRSVFFNLDAKF